MPLLSSNLRKGEAQIHVILYNDNEETENVEYPVEVVNLLG